MRTILFQLLTLALASATVTMNSNLLLHMTFDTLPASDESTYQRGIITYGNVTLVPGKFGNAVQVNPKSGDFSNAFYTGQFQVANQLSAMAWVQFADANMFGDHSKIMSSKNGYTDAGGFEVQYYQGVITFLAGGNGGGAGASTANSKTQTITPNTWYHIAVTANGGQANIYVNGIDVTASGAITPVKAFPGKDITVGSSCNGAKVNAGGQWHGLLDEVRLYDVALAPNVIQQIFQEDDSVPSAGTSKLTSGVEALCLADAVPQSTPSLQLIYKDIPTDAQGKQYIGHSNSYMTFSNTKTHTDAGSMSHTTGVLTLKNAGSSALQLVSAKIQDTSLFTLSGFNAQSLAPGATLDLTVTFVGQGSDKTVLRSYLDITTDDQANPTTRVTLAGVFMLENEGGNEIPLESILGAFGFSVHTGITWVDEGIEYLNHTQTSMDEVSSFLWRTVDSSLPFRLQTIAGFSPCCQGNPGVSVSAATGVNCAVQLKPGYTQTVWPIAGSGSAAVAACSIDPSNRFGLVQDGTWFSNTPLSNAGFKSMHFYPARDADGTLIPNTYVVGHDYSLPTGCGGKDGQANCDYQDNVFLISNVAPADHTSLDRSAVVAIPIEYSFSSVSSSGLSDSNGQPIGFTQYLPNSMDTSVSINSFQPSLITLNPSSNSLTVQAVSGSPFGDENKLVNALRVPINPNGKSFGASLTVDFNSLVSGLTVGLFVGSDQDNFYAVYYKNGMIYASAELMQVDQTQNQQNPVFPQFQTNSYSFGNLSLPTGLTNVTFIIGVDPSNRTITPAVSFDGNVPQYFGGMWVLPGRSESSGLGYSGRLLGFGTGAGPFAFASDASGSNAKVNFLQFGINTCSASTLPAAVSQGQTAISQQSSPITSPTGIDSNPQDGPGQSNSDSIGIQTSNNNGGSPSGSNTIASSSSRSGVVFSILLLSVALFI